ncbi:iron-containing redox enzyme family protein [Streptomyces sp. FH025]|uniref:iron-containing redox enzyme family protein n=1 Tax=Streptomyces sp. FH025 TaxID=2815937 RepID=UPI001A9CE1F6|nr:iron-containing redox enzyme family protein [Streptomyces sp. FH025]MBO1415386.1 iron-containing redox enzyme family protein [Streptomyces sp. FH025]
MDGEIKRAWGEIHAGPFWRHLLDKGLDRELYRIFMAQLWHYTQHNPINQSFAAWRVPPAKMGLLRYCFEHAEEELGHEKMIEHDLRAVDLLDDTLDAPALPATTALIGYLYSVGLRDGAIARLGYSYWAENAYPYITDLLEHMRTDLGLADREMSFFVAHAEIDAKHSKEVKEQIERWAGTPDEQQAVLTVARTSLWLTGQLFDASLHAYQARG